MNWPALLTTEKAAEYLGLGETSLKSLKAAGHIKTVVIKLPGSSKPVVRYRLSDLDELYGEGSFSGSK